MRALEINPPYCKWLSIDSVLLLSVAPSVPIFGNSFTLRETNLLRNKLCSNCNGYKALCYSSMPFMSLFYPVTAALFYRQTPLGGGPFFLPRRVSPQEYFSLLLRPKFIWNLFKNLSKNKNLSFCVRIPLSPSLFMSISYLYQYAFLYLLTLPVTVYKAIYIPKYISAIQPQAIQCDLGWDGWVYHPPYAKALL